MLNQRPFKVKVGVYAALLTMAALVAGGGVMMLTLYFYQISELDKTLEEDARELVWDLKNFSDSPKDPRLPLGEQFIPVPLRARYLIVEGPEGQIVYQSRNLHGERLQSQVGRAHTVKLLGKTCLVGAWREGPYLIRVGAKINMVERFIKDLGVGFAAGLPVVGLVVFVGGVWLGRRTVAPLAELSAAAERISTRNPDERLPIPPTQDEIARLTEVLNRSFDRLQASYRVAARFSADASHQLKTPVAILRAGLDHLSTATDLSEAQAEEVATLRQQTRRLNSLIEDLLLLARADAGRMEIEREPIDLKSLVEAAGDDLAAIIADKHIQLELDLADSLPVHADKRLVAMALLNLVENASKYTPAGGSIRISGHMASGYAVVSIANTGAALSEDDRMNLFERFRRGSDTGGEVRGHGLGLNIARELIRAHGGDVVLNAAKPGWIEFELRLPVKNVA
jgi:signal transduction histidine kinase